MHSNDTVGKDFKRAEAISIPLTFVILWVAFSSLVAALLPVALALSAILIATGLVTLTSHALPIDQDAHSMILLDRPRRGRRLLPILSSVGPARSVRRGARIATHSPWPPRPRVGGAHLRADRRRRDGGHVPHRPRHVHRHGGGDRDRRDCRDARLADRPTGA